MKKFTLVLSGGGFKGAFQIGVLRRLKQHWSVINPGSDEMKFDVLAGVSVGSLNAALVASNEFDALEQIWLDIGESVEHIYTSDFIDTAHQGDELKWKLDMNMVRERFLPNVGLELSFWQGLGLLFSNAKRRKFARELLERAGQDFANNFQQFRSLADNSPLRERLKGLISKDKIENTVCKCGFVSLDDGEYYSFDHSSFKTDEEFRNAVLASTAMPIVWEPIDKIAVAKGGVEKVFNQNIDGGIRNVSPLGDVIDEINSDDPTADYTIIIINCSSGAVEEGDYSDANIAGIALRAMNDIAGAEIFNNDITEFLRINDIIEQVRAVHPDMQIRDYDIRQGRTDKVLRRFKAIIIRPDPRILGNTLVTNAQLNARRIEHGEKKAEEVLGILSRSGGSMDLVKV